ncbi:MAG: alpha/beta hydrolase [Betaproteobacteria bacterium]|nr:MAG: alpha/beta hydrolase [Betaproteobacteria bacterium]
MKKVFRDYDQAALDAQYEQRAWVPHADDIIRRFGEASDEVRARLGEPGTYAYGASAAETLDVYGFSTRKALVFVHGGAWKRQSKRENAFAAETFIHAGAAYVALDFALLPSITLPEMVGQVCRAIEWVASNLSENVFLCGHSSGAHLAASALTRVACVRAALVVSGIYDLLPVRLSARNVYVRLDERLEHEYSPIRHTDRIRCPVTVVWAEKESAEFARQSREFAEKLKAPAHVGNRMNHFEIIETLANPRSPLAKIALEMIA